MNNLQGTSASACVHISSSFDGFSRGRECGWVGSLLPMWRRPSQSKSEWYVFSSPLFSWLLNPNDFSSPFFHFKIPLYHVCCLPVVLATFLFKDDMLRSPSLTAVSYHPLLRFVSLLFVSFFCFCSIISLLIFLLLLHSISLTRRKREKFEEEEK